MRRYAIVLIVALCWAGACSCHALASTAVAAEPPQTLPAPLQIAAAPPAPQTKAPDATTLNERVIALEKENLVLREDLGKARLDVRTAVNKQSEEMARMQKKIDDLNAQLAIERDKQSKRSKNMWIAIGIVALGVIAAN